jgi:ATP-dependent Clp protease adapter protein ClpS
MPVLSENLVQSLHRALAIAGAGHHEYATLEHLLLALIEDPEAAVILRKCNVDLEKLRRNLVTYIESELAKFATDSSENSKASAGLQRLIQRADTHAQSIAREEVTVANVLVAIFAERESQAATLLEEQGMTRYDATLYVSHGIGKAERLSRDRGGVARAVSVEPSGLLAKVLLLNDDYTPMEFVVHVLERVFDKDHEAAVRIMFEIHNGGAGICGIYPYDAADAKVTEVLDLAHQHQHPLQCVLEQSASM